MKLIKGGESVKQIIIYGSQYGHAKQYAEALASQTNIELVSFSQVGDINHYDRIIYIGAVYAGGVKGLAKTFRKLKPNRIKEVIIATVGLADPTNPENSAHIKESIKKQIPPSLYPKAKIFHLRGGIDYGNLNFLHRMMMKTVYKSAKKQAPENQTAENKELIATYGQVVNFIDLKTLRPIIESL